MKYVLISKSDYKILAQILETLPLFLVFPRHFCYFYYAALSDPAISLFPSLSFSREGLNFKDQVIKERFW